MTRPNAAVQATTSSLPGIVVSGRDSAPGSLCTYTAPWARETSVGCGRAPYANCRESGPQTKELTWSPSGETGRPISGSRAVRTTSHRRAKSEAYALSRTIALPRALSRSCSARESGELAVYTRRFESGDNLKLETADSCFVICHASPPLGSMPNTCARLSVRSEIKASHDPSVDHCGARSARGPDVTRRASPPVVDTIQTSELLTLSAVLRSVTT